MNAVLQQTPAFPVKVPQFNLAQPVQLKDIYWVDLA
jgi:hypothetical protein